MCAVHNMSALYHQSLEEREKNPPTPPLALYVCTFAIHSFQFTKELETSSIKIPSEIQQTLK